MKHYYLIEQFLRDETEPCCFIGTGSAVYGKGAELVKASHCYTSLVKAQQYADKLNWKEFPYSKYKVVEVPHIMVKEEIA